MTPRKTEPPIFSDPGHRRRHLVRVLALLAGMSVTIWITSFALSIFYVGKLPQTPSELIESCSVGAERSPATLPALSARSSEPCGPPAPSSCPGDLRRSPDDPRRTVFTFLPRDEVWSFETFREPCFATDYLLTEAYHVTDAVDGPFAVGPDQETALVADFLGSRRGRSIRVWPVVRFKSGAWRSWMGGSQPDPSLLAAQIETRVSRAKGAGLCLWFEEGLPGGTGNAVETFLGELRPRLDGTGADLCVIVPSNTDFAKTPWLAQMADKVILQGFAPVAPGARPGPLAPQSWFETRLGTATAAVDPDKLVIALGTHSVDWITGETRPQTIPFAEAMRRASRFDGTVQFPEGIRNTRIQAVDTDGRRHTIWTLDAVSAFNQLQTMHRRGLEQVAVWPAGYEDPGLWTALRLPQSLPPETAAGLLSEVHLDDYVGYEGEGAFLFLLASQAPGTRILSTDPASGEVVAQSYATVPRPYSFQRYGHRQEPLVALTFDDGPDSKYTAQILDILAEKGVTGTFFEIGSNIIKSPDITRRIVAEGHEIGSHTFFHPRMETISDLRITLELNALQRLFVSVTGRRTLLFRTPYGYSAGPLTGETARPVAAIDEADYIPVGSDITPRDWEHLSAEEIVAFVQSELATGAGNVIVLHDAGGDRQETVKALPLLIDTLRADGYQFASLGQLIGIGRDQLMPPDTGLRARFDGFSFGLIQAVRQGIAWVFWFVVIVGTARSAVFLALPLLRRRPQDGPGEFRPPVTVLVPAYNEEDVIQRNMQAVLDSAYDDLRIVVIDDGSTDGTLARLNEAYGNDPRVTILSEPNRGKWLALDRAYDEVTTDFVIAIDADTLIAPDAIAKLVAHFRDPKVGAVAGNVRVGNRQNLLTALQSLEYVTAQNIDRRAAEVFDGVMVVPGAIGAWRVDAVRKVGLYSNQTLTEDADLTVSVLRLGYHVVFEEHAYSVTEVPATIRGFLLQRLRWSLGMMQTAWKHRGAASEGRAIGLITIPDLFLFGVVMPLLAPLADLLFLGTLIDFLVNILTGQTGLIDRAAVQVLLGYLALPAMDFFKAALALHYEKTERWTLLLVQPFQRILYQPLLYLSALRALFRAIDGKPTPWTKLVHRGTAMSPRA